MEQNINALWLLVSSALVLLMQGGFLALEAGLVRSKNTINVAIKNLTDFAISTIVFWAFGFALMFGTTAAGVVGTSHLILDFEPGNFSFVSFFIFQLMFCGTAVTIVSGAIAERVKFSSYIFISVLIASFVYPIFGHWAWNGLDAGEAKGWLASLGFVDFAGSTVVHSVGGWSSLAILQIVGARYGRFDDDGKPRTIAASNLPLATLGVILLWFGWIGFNGGSALGFSDHVAKILLNTILASGAGLLSALAVGWSRKGQADIELVMNGSLAGLVAITAGAHAVSAPAAVFIGAMGGVVMSYFSEWLLKRGIDDAVGAVPVHLSAGIWGTLAVGIFGSTAILNTDLSRIEQILVQLLGIAVAGVWVYGVNYIVLSTLNHYYPLRVSLEAEQLGLNVSEHGVTTEIHDLFTVIDYQAKTGDMSLRVPAEPFTQIGQIAKRYNQIMDALEESTARNEAIVRASRDSIFTITPDTLLIKSVNPAGLALFGYRRRELYDRPFIQLLSPRESEGMTLGTEHLAEIFKRRLRENSHFETNGLNREGDTFPIEFDIEETDAPNQADKYYIVFLREQLEPVYSD
jgi:Amt family ammonium transporter